MTITPPAHPLAELLRGAAAGRFPPAGGAVRFLPAPPGMAGAVVGLTGTTVIAAGLDPDEVRAELASRDALGGPMEAGFLVWLGTRLGVRPGDLDMVLAHPGAAAGVGPDGGTAPRLLRRTDLDTHPRVRQAGAQGRTGVDVYEEERGRAVATIGRGLAGRVEVSVEVATAHRGAGLSGPLIAAAVHLAPPGEPVFAQVSPGNASSVRAFWRAGFRPVGAEVLFVGDPGT